MPADFSVHGASTDWLINITLVFVTILFVIMVGWMLIACVRFTRKHPARPSTGDSTNATTAKLGVAALIFLGVDGNLFVNSTLDLERTIWNFGKALSHPDAVRIEVNARQWAWDVRYAGPDGAFNSKDDIVTTNDMRVPVGVPVVMQLGASDVLHSLYIPNMRVKQDVIPGNITWAWFQAKGLGEFEIGCAQHCGNQHYQMRGKLTVLTREDFAAWATTASQNSAAAFNPEDGEAHWGWPWQEPPHGR